MRFFNFFLTYMVQKYQNEFSPIFYYAKKLKTSGKLLKIPDLHPPDWGQPYWMTRYLGLWFKIHTFSETSTCSIWLSTLRIILKTFLQNIFMILKKILLYLLNVSDFFESVLLKVHITGLEDNWREAVRISINRFTWHTETHPADWSLELGDKSRWGLTTIEEQ